MESGRMSEALPHARRVVERWPDDAPSHEMLGYVLLRRGDHEGARTALRLSLALSPTARAWHNLAICEYELGDKNAAADAMERFASLTTDEEKRTDAAG